MNKIILAFASSVFLLLASHLSAQLSDVKITLEDKRILEGKADEKIITQGFEGLLLHQGQEQRYIRFSELKKISFGEHVFVKQPIKYQSLETEILIENFIGGDVILYKGYQLNGEKLFFIGRKNEETILKINNKAIDNVLNYYFEDCPSWKKIAPNRHVYSEDWFVKLAKSNESCFSTTIPLTTDYQVKRMRWAFSGGINYYSVSMLTSENDFIYDPELFETSNSFSLEGAYHGIFNDFISLKQSLSWYNFNSYTPYINYYPFSIEENYSEVTFRLSYVELKTMGRVNFSRKPLTPFVKGGINMTYLVANNTEELAFETFGYANRPKNFKFSTSQFIPMIGGGISCHMNSKFEVAIEYLYMVNRLTVFHEPREGEDVINPNILFWQQRHQAGLFFIYHL